MILSLFICLLYTNMIILREIKLVLLAEFKWLMDGIAESNCSIWFFVNGLAMSKLELVKVPIVGTFSCKALSSNCNRTDVANHENWSLIS